MKYTVEFLWQDSKCDLFQAEVTLSKSVLYGLNLSSSALIKTEVSAQLTFIRFQCSVRS